MVYKVSFLVFLAILASGCSGRHSVPDLDYAHDKSEDGVFSVAFDQDGSIYPAYSRADLASANMESGFLDWNEHVMPAWKYWIRFGFHDSAFMLKSIQKSGYPGAYYDELRRRKITKELAKDMAEALEGRDRLYVFIHGFNNSYADATDVLNSIHSAVDTSDGVVLNVYWDGLYAPSFLAGLPIYRWNDSLTYSNLAGQVGLRAVLQNIGRPVDVVFVTHSRGAGVAISALFDPLYDSHIIVGSSTPLSAESVRSAKLVMLAPAVGSGHVVSDAFITGDPEMNVAMYVVANRSDSATCKIVFGGDFNGDSRMGCGRYRGYINEALEKARRFDIETDSLIFDEGTRFWPSSHSVETYLQACDVQRFLADKISIRGAAACGTGG